MVRYGAVSLAEFGSGAVLVRRVELWCGQVSHDVARWGWLGSGPERFYPVR